MSDQQITPGDLSTEALDPETVANESRKAREQVRADERRGVVGEIEDVVTSMTKPLAEEEERPTEEQIEKQRVENDREQR